ncbi:MAG: response regulator, partial [Thiomargarita sp.]|nr:response regulator [Thiomargarita sp.]
MIEKQSPLILIVDDHSQNLSLLGNMLREHGYRFVIAETGREALDFVKKKIPDLILLDIMMPEMDGIEAAKMLRFMQSGREKLPIIMLTADATIDAIRACEDAGIDIYLTKPIESEKLLATIASLSPRKQKTCRPRSSVDLQTIDYESLNKLASLSKSADFMNNLIFGFLEDTEKLINQIDLAIEQVNLSTVQNHSHAIKGSARSVGATSLAQCASLIEDQAQTGALYKLPALSSELHHEYNLTRSTL